MLSLSPWVSSRESKATSSGLSAALSCGTSGMHMHACVFVCVSQLSNRLIERYNVHACSPLIGIHTEPALYTHTHTLTHPFYTITRVCACVCAAIQFIIWSESMLAGHPHWTSRRLRSSSMPKSEYHTHAHTHIHRLSCATSTHLGLKTRGPDTCRRGRGLRCTSLSSSSIRSKLACLRISKEGCVACLHAASAASTAYMCACR